MKRSISFYNEFSSISVRLSSSNIITWLSRTSLSLFSLQAVFLVRQFRIGIDNVSTQLCIASGDVVVVVVVVVVVDVVVVVVVTVSAIAFESSPSK